MYTLTHLKVARCECETEVAMPVGETLFQLYLQGDFNLSWSMHFTINHYAVTIIRGWEDNIITNKNAIIFKIVQLSPKNKQAEFREC